MQHVNKLTVVLAFLAFQHLLQLLSPIWEPRWAQITQMFMDKMWASTVQLILYNYNDAHGQTGKVGDAWGWGCLLSTYVLFVSGTPPPQPPTSHEHRSFVAEKICNWVFVKWRIHVS
jgi:hypothetical protein